MYWYKSPVEAPRTSNTVKGTSSNLCFKLRREQRRPVIPRADLRLKDNKLGVSACNLPALCSSSVTRLSFLRSLIALGTLSVDPSKALAADPSYLPEDVEDTFCPTCAATGFRGEFQKQRALQKARDEQGFPVATRTE
ncbi:hypothetical protein CYMTET_33775 [Cymbomonas tetramitiformis]|uniref:Uncharacterized protein n=1 Tax=Cymbomonas tetramitiformis TaxID=36881 RepID=A0AAE0FCE3_9CHLO|nr:hypothetical protein CYMTET_33775 [Cymbomonas tetramitiformis]